MRRAGIKAVAQHADVSVGTVSNVLNRPDAVSAATRARVEAAMVELAFVRNAAASSLRAGRSFALGLLVPDIGNPFFAAVVRGVEAAAGDHGYSVLLCNADNSADREARHLRFLEEHRVDGVLVTPVDKARLPLLRSRGTPVVLLDEPAGRGQCSASVDDVRGGELAGNHLVAIGRRRISYVTGPSGIRQAADRGVGLRRAVNRRITEVVLPALTGEQGFLATRQILAGSPDAVFCANDVVALGVLRGLLDADVAVPADIALMGYDDIEFAGTAAIPLTSVRQPAQELGDTATRLLLAEISGGRHRHEQRVFQPELVVRSSTVATARGNR